MATNYSLGRTFFNSLPATLVPKYWASCYAQRTCNFKVTFCYGELQKYTTLPKCLSESNLLSSKNDNVLRVSTCLTAIIRIELSIVYTM